MARAGGARDEENGVAPEARGGAETTPLLAPGGDGAGVQEEEARGDSLPGAVANVCMSMLGAGQLTLPYALSTVGLAGGCVTLGALGVLGAYTLHALDAAARGTRARTYGELVEATLGARAREAADLMLAVYAFGGAVAFMLIASEELRLLLNALLPNGHPLWEADRRVLLAVVTCLLVLPLSCLRSLSFLKPVSTLGSVAALFITFVVVVSAKWSPGGALEVCGGDTGALRMWPESPGAYMGAVPLFAFALNSAWSFVPVRASLRAPTRARVRTLIALSKVGVLANYFVIMVVGYLSLCGGDIADNVLDSLAHTPVVLVARGALALQLCLALPLRFLVARSVLLRAGAMEQDGRSLAFYGTTLALVLGSLALASVTDSLHLVIGITSSVCASALIYVLPGAAHYKLLWERTPPLSSGGLFFALMLPALCVAVGVVLLTAGTAFNVIESVGGA